MERGCCQATKTFEPGDHLKMKNKLLLLLSEAPSESLSPLLFFCCSFSSFLFLFWRLAPINCGGYCNAWGPLFFTQTKLVNPTPYRYTVPSSQIPKLPPTVYSTTLAGPSYSSVRLSMISWVHERQATCPMTTTTTSVRPSMQFLANILFCTTMRAGGWRLAGWGARGECV